MPLFATGAAAPIRAPEAASLRSAPPRQAGYFRMAPAGRWRPLPGDRTCAGRVHLSSWEPRPDNAVPNHRMPRVAAVHRAFRLRPVHGGGATDRRWDTWLLQRVDGHYKGTTDEIFQWAACKWGLRDNVLRAIAVRESTWYQYEIYPSGRPVLNWGSGDLMPPRTRGAVTYCDALARHGRDYQRDFGRGICPRTFSIAGVMSWEAPSWGRMPGNQNGTYPFNRRSTAFAVDYLAGQLRGCYNGWEFWLSHSGHYAAGDLWGCVGAWYAGAWHSAAANDYIHRVRRTLRHHRWLARDWPNIRPSCSQAYGCPTGSH